VEGRGRGCKDRGHVGLYSLGTATEVCGALYTFYVHRGTAHTHRVCRTHSARVFAATAASPRLPSPSCASPRAIALSALSSKPDEAPSTLSGTARCDTLSERRLKRYAMVPEGSQQPLAEDQMRRTWALVDILTLLKRRGNHPPPTAELIRRKFGALSLPALDTLSIMVDSAIAEKHRRLSPRQICGMVQAIRVFQEDTASEVAHVHACNNVVSATAVKRASCVAAHELRIGLQHLAEARKRGIPLSPIPTDLHAHAMNAVADSESTALKILGIGDVAVQESGSFASSTGLLTGTAFCIAILDRLHLRTDICCGSCHRIVSADELSICRRCGDHLACKECLGHATHASECGRVRSSVRSMAHSIMPHIRESARRVAVVQLSSSGLMVPMGTTSITSPLIPSSLYESLSRCSVVNPQDLHVYWRLLISFLANQEGDEQEAIEFERLHGLEAAEEATVEHQPNAASKGPKLLPSERRRLQKEA